jgi:hypothetical protein
MDGAKATPIVKRKQANKPDIPRVDTVKYTMSSNEG